MKLTQSLGEWMDCTQIFVTVANLTGNLTVPLSNEASVVLENIWTDNASQFSLSHAVLYPLTRRDQNGTISPSKPLFCK